ncbi:MAG TPA: YjbE family putative metal transport protein [Casimicrobiaceae bacterium]|nr:YjbE family putative metal transport protein [Casimicrobiaceae bacterium]
MEILSSQFVLALGAIVIIDLVLAGDNAIVIALAVRHVPKPLQRRAILWGTFGAIAVRVSLTSVVVWLLRVPGLMAIGGAMLVWIAYRLLSSKEAEDDQVRIDAVSGFWGAVRTVVVADALMGLDNVLAVAGAAHGSFLLVVLGLLISIPIVVWGSTLMLRFIERHPVFVYVGAGVLAATAVRMVAGEPLLQDALRANGAIVPVMYGVVVLAVLGVGFVRNHRRLESRISARLAQFVDPAADPPRSHEGETMRKILVPVDASPNALHAVRHVVDLRREDDRIAVHLLNVQVPFPRHIAQFVARRDVAAFHHERGREALRAAARLLDNAGVPYTSEVQIGHKAELIAATAARLDCDHIVMSTARKNSLTRMVEASTTNRVLELTSVPVKVIAGHAVSKVERYGIPAAIAALLGALVVAAVVD